MRIGHLSKDNEEELKRVLLKEKVMSALDRNHTEELHVAMKHQYERRVHKPLPPCFHSALSWLTKKRGVIQGNQAFVMIV